MGLSQKQIEFAKNALSDTAFLAREVLGYNYDEDAEGRKIRVGKGGMLAVGKTKELVDILDDDSIKRKYFKLPRGSRKSTWAQCFCVRMLLRYPDTRIFYVARTDAMSREKALAIRSQLENPNVVKYFGNQRGTKWGETEFTVASRENSGLQNASFQSFSQDSIPTGGRANIVIADDFIDASNCTNPEQIKKSKRKWAELMPLVAPGGFLIVFCTTWDDDDLNSALEASRLFVPPLGAQLICGAGVHITWKDNVPDIEPDEGGVTFPHLTIEHLREKFHAMTLQGNIKQFCQQYLNINTGSASDGFKREYFKYLRWDESMAGLSGYLVTDTASSMEPGSCYSVVGYVGLDKADNIYILDMRVGHWNEGEFTDHFFEVLEEWQPRVNHCGECWEAVALATSYRGHIENDSRARRTKLRTIEMKRPSTSVKNGRILRFLPRMQRGEFYVVDTVPKMFADINGERTLFDPTGHWDGTASAWKPGGELVDEFIRETAKKDIPDALAMILEYAKLRGGRHKRLCTYKPGRAVPDQTSLTGGRPVVYDSAEPLRGAFGPVYEPGSSEWWERTIARF